MRGLVDVGLRLLAKPTATPPLSYDEKSMITVPVEVKPRPYAALIENGLLAKAGALLRELLPARSRLFVITVAPVRRKWGKVLMGSLAGRRVCADPDYRTRAGGCFGGRKDRRQSQSGEEPGRHVPSAARGADRSASAVVVAGTRVSGGTL